jgi:hypothetical protein
MAETPREGAKGPSGSRDADILPTDRGAARALLQRRVKAAKARPEWAYAVRMAGALAPTGSSQEEMDVWALRCIEDGILTFTDLVRAVGRQGHP